MGIFVHGHQLVGEMNSFPRAKFNENCENQGVDVYLEKKPNFLFFLFFTPAVTKGDDWKQ